MVALMGTDPTGAGTGLEAVGERQVVEPSPLADALDPAGVLRAAAPTESADADITWMDGNRAQKRAAARGYVHKRRVYVLHSDDPAKADLEVKARSVSLGRFLSLLKLAATLDRFDDGALTLTEADVDAITSLFEGFGDALVSWTLKDPDTEQPIPASREGLWDLDADFAMELVDTWMTAVGGVAAPLGQTSTSGAPSLEASLPMVAPSQSPSS